MFIDIFLDTYVHSYVQHSSIHLCLTPLLPTPHSSTHYSYPSHLQPLRGRLPGHNFLHRNPDQCPPVLHLHFDPTPLSRRLLRRPFPPPAALPPPFPHPRPLLRPPFSPRLVLRLLPPLNGVLSSVSLWRCVVGRALEALPPHNYADAPAPHRGLGLLLRPRRRLRRLQGRRLLRVSLYTSSFVTASSISSDLTLCCSLHRLSLITSSLWTEPAKTAPPTTVHPLLAPYLRSPVPPPRRPLSPLTLHHTPRPLTPPPRRRLRVVEYPPVHEGSTTPPDPPRPYPRTRYHRNLPVIRHTT